MIDAMMKMPIQCEESGTLFMAHLTIRKRQEQTGSLEGCERKKCEHKDIKGYNK